MRLSNTVYESVSLSPSPSLLQSASQSVSQSFIWFSRRLFDSRYCYDEWIVIMWRVELHFRMEWTTLQTLLFSSCLTSPRQHDGWIRLNTSSHGSYAPLRHKPRCVTSEKERESLRIRYSLTSDWSRPSASLFHPNGHVRMGQGRRYRKVPLSLPATSDVHLFVT